LTSTIYADGGSDVMNKAYDSVGDVTQRIDQRGITTLYMYDSLHRLTKKQDNPTSPTIVESYAYDGLSRLTQAQLARSGTAQSAVSYYYDPLSRATPVTGLLSARARLSDCTALLVEFMRKIRLGRGALPGPFVPSRQRSIGTAWAGPAGR
jgi:YD repeat-containing protein